MIYKFKLPGKRGPDVKVSVSFFTGKTRVWVRGKEVKSESKKFYNIPVTKTRTEQMRLSPNIFNLGLDVIYKDQRINVSRKVTKLEYVTSYAPVLLGVVASSMYGANVYKSAIMGVLSVFFSLFNMKILQGDRPELAKLIYNGVVIAVSWFVFWGIAKI